MPLALPRVLLVCCSYDLGVSFCKLIGILIVTVCCSYDRGVKHAGDVYYALVCRVALGDPLSTTDGRTACKVGNIYIYTYIYICRGQ
jgi:hypothetical protein